MLSAAAVALADRMAPSRVQREASMHSVVMENWRSVDLSVQMLAMMTIKYLKPSVWSCSTAENTPSCRAAKARGAGRGYVCVCIPLPASLIGGQLLLSPSCPPLQAVWDENLVNNRSHFTVPCLPSAFQPQVTGIGWCQLPYEDSHPPLSHALVQHS